MDLDVHFSPAKGADFKISSASVGSLLAEISSSTDASIESIAGQLPGGSQTQVKKKRPIELLHNLQAEEMAKDERNYTGFEDGKAEDSRIGNREARISSFTYKIPSLFGSSPGAGKRVTILTLDKQVSVVYRYPKSIEKDVKPSFEKMLKTISFDAG